MKTKKKFNIERVREFCKLVNEGVSPSLALKNMNTCNGYSAPLREAGFYWKEKNGQYRAVERVHMERYLLFAEKKNEYNIKRINKKFVKQPTLFCVPKQKAVKPVSKSNNDYFNNSSFIRNTAPKVFFNNNKLSFIQRLVKKFFNL
jgi:hypothetical protein